MNNLVSINILTWNSEKYIENCLGAVFAQSYRELEINIIDNDSRDKSRDILKRIIANNPAFNINLILNDKNVGFAVGHNQAIRISHGEFILALNCDVVLDSNFVAKAIEIFRRNEKIGSIQAKIYQLQDGRKTTIIDTVGFKLFKSGRIIDEGHGFGDDMIYNTEKQIFGVNGAAPIYRKLALDDVAIANRSNQKEYFDEDFFAYVEDVDLAWRLRWRGWQCVFAPSIIAWHDRFSSKRLKKNWLDFVKLRRSQSFFAKKLNWRNQWFLFIKNQSFINFVLFLPWFLWRQTQLFLYLMLFEPKILMVIPYILRLSSKMLKKRRLILKTRKVSDREMRKWFCS